VNFHGRCTSLAKPDQEPAHNRVFFLRLRRSDALADFPSRALRRLEALLIVGTPEHLFVLSGNGDVIEPDEGIVAIGSGGPYAQAAATALVRNTSLDAEKIARAALDIAADICVYTNRNVTIESLKT